MAKSNVHNRHENWNTCIAQLSKTFNKLIEECDYNLIIFPTLFGDFNFFGFCKIFQCSFGCNLEKKKLQSENHSTFWLWIGNEESVEGKTLHLIKMVVNESEICLFHKQQNLPLACFQCTKAPVNNVMNLIKTINSKKHLTFLIFGVPSV